MLIYEYSYIKTDDRKKAFSTVKLALLSAYQASREDGDVLQIVNPSDINHAWLNYLFLTLQFINIRSFL